MVDAGMDPKKFDQEVWWERYLWWAGSKLATYLVGAPRDDDKAAFYVPWFASRWIPFVQDHGPAIGALRRSMELLGTAP